MNNYHVPVLLHESVDALVTNPSGTYVDVTFGGGGHSQAILDKLDANGKLIAFDRDSDALKNTLHDERFTLIHHNFKFSYRFLKYFELLPIDGVLADLGISSHQINVPGRGFAHRFDGPLDMRMDSDLAQSAADVVNHLGEKELSDLFYKYGELKNSRSIAKNLVSFRTKQQITEIDTFKIALEDVTPKANPAKFYSQVFQALRIHINGELNSLQQLLLDAPKILKEDGRLVVISYHSLEDRLVKNFIQTGNLEGNSETDFYGNRIRPFEPLQAKAMVPNHEENTRNSRARSAKLRIGVRQKWNPTN